METRPTVLVVDDESSLRWVLRKGLTKAGYDVEEAEDAHTGLRLLRQHDFVAVILDINMPGMTGLDALDEIAAIRAGTPVLIITAQNSMTNAIEAMRRGAVDYFTKPFSMDELRLKVRQHLEVNRLKQENVLLKRALGKSHAFCDIIGRSPAMVELFKMVEQG